MIALFLIYVCRSCRRHLPRTRGLYPPRTRGLDAEIINSLPLFLLSTLESDETAVTESECSICLRSFEDHEMVRVLPICHHVFHSECVDIWLTTRSSCPLCRTSVDHSICA
ncbi:hypothetical protein Leryth_026211 [Lithospermum erythrorhizon]|nr:hypothetical protein Leryth_026211 [Lithospermum erythrorhizon]